MQIEDLTTWAKEFTLQDGTHAPTLFVETDKPEMVVAGLANLPATPDERLTNFIALGRAFAAQRPNEHIRSIAFVVMSWGTKQMPDEPAPTLRPSQDPNRVEFLLITQVTVGDGDALQLDGRMVEIIRDGAGKIRDLYELPATMLGGQSPLLVGFITGFQNATLTEQEIQRIMQDMRGPT